MDESPEARGNRPLYVLDGRIPVRVDQDDPRIMGLWHEWCEMDEAELAGMVASTPVGEEFYVLTGFSCVDLRQGRENGEKPLLFETRLKGREWEYGYRLGLYSDWEEAASGHESAVKLCQDENNLAAMAEFYILVNGTLTPAKEKVWIDWLDENQERFTLLENIQAGEKQIEVETKFVGADWSMNTGVRPMPWQSIVLGGPLDLETRGYYTEEDARAGHEELIGLVRASLS